ncbi:MAG: 4Fe-4S dicluster domain-containing protein [Candidatus Helarchaeota archaeon]
MSNLCTQCDECTKACPLSIITGQKALWGIFFNQNFNIWDCTSCFRCEAACPLELSVRDALFEKRRSIKYSNFPSKYRIYFESLLKTGNVFPLDNLVNEQRQQIGLEPINFERIRIELKKLLVDNE